MKFLSLVAFIGSAIATEQQVMVLFDVTLKGLRDTRMPLMLADALESIAVDDPSTTFAVSHFTDKPVPLYGVGPYGGFEERYLEDWCYDNSLKFTSNIETVKESIKTLPVGTGLDQWEGQFDAIVAASVDSSVGWSASADKVILLVTDSYGHSGIMQRLVDTVSAYNHPVRCAGAKTAGGFGAIDTTSLVDGWVADFDLYDEYANLHHKRSCVKGGLNSTEKARYDTIQKFYRVRQYPQVRPFDADIWRKDADTACRFHEYPTYEEVGAVLLEENVKLFLLFANPGEGRAADHVIWEWVLSEPSALGVIPNVYSMIENLHSMEDKGTESLNMSLESILREGLKKLTS